MRHYGERQLATVARVISVVATQQGVAVELIEPNTRFIEDLQMYDHLEGIELALAIRDEFGLEISEADGDAMHTVGDLVAHVIKGHASKPT